MYEHDTQETEYPLEADKSTDSSRKWKQFNKRLSEETGTTEEPVQSQADTLVDHWKTWLWQYGSDAVERQVAGQVTEVEKYYRWEKKTLYNMVLMFEPGTDKVASGATSLKVAIEL